MDCDWVLCSSQHLKHLTKSHGIKRICIYSVNIIPAASLIRELFCRQAGWVLHLSYFKMLFWNVPDILCRDLACIKSRILKNIRIRVGVCIVGRGKSIFGEIALLSFIIVSKRLSIHISRKKV